MEKFGVLVSTLPGAPNVAVAVAASRAGAVGVVDLQHRWSHPLPADVFDHLGRLARQGCGVRVEASSPLLADGALAAWPEAVELVVLTRPDADDVAPLVARLRARGLRVLVEAVSVSEARAAAAAGADGVVAKGNEAGGRVGRETTFVLLQRCVAELSAPVWAQGGIGLHSAAACRAAGAAGVVLDAQLALVREQSLPRAARHALARMDGSETITVGDALGEPYRLYQRPGRTGADDLAAVEDELAGDAGAPGEWRAAVDARVGWGDEPGALWLVGQDAAFASSLAERYRTVGGVVDALRRSVDGHVAAAAATTPLAAGAPLARAHGTRFPVVQGPMTRVSDTADFAAKVAEGGALPLLALALMGGDEVDALLTDTARALGERPWGVGILGFVPREVAEAQARVVSEHRPPYALIAGGRPDQAVSLEEAGTRTYLHVPSPGLLELFLRQGARRFVFEGRECGGHVGPRSSFVLWNSMVDVLAAVPPDDLAGCHVLFAGGVHDALSASMVATLAAPLAEQGAKVGVLMGTAYLFTEEAVAAGAIVEGYQAEALRTAGTVLLHTGPGHSIRCAPTAYAEHFAREHQRLLDAGASPDEVRDTLEDLNLGRLRLASKGLVRADGPDGAHRLDTVDGGAQRRDGMYMLGDVAALHEATCTIEDLHHDVCEGGTARLAPRPAPAEPRAAEPPSDVAIVGMATLLPQAPDLDTYWENILDGVDAIREVPRERWDVDRYFAADPDARDKVSSRWGGFLDEVPFDPTSFGMPPATVPSIEPVQLLTLNVVRAALADAGYLDRPFARERTSVVLGVGGGAGDLGQQYAVRAALPSLLEDVPEAVLDGLPEWTEDSFPGILLNVTAGRVANRFDLGGVNCTVDAACASSLAAVHIAVRELESGASDVVIAGAADTVQNPFAYLCFSKTHALSPRGRCRPFDAGADGIAISEGVAAMVLKRLADAEHDGDRIYAVIKGVAGSSDGRARGLTAPHPGGQALAMQRAYAKAGFSPATVGLIEAHGTGTVAGDASELSTLGHVFGEADAAPQSCAVGSVKSMIGHTKCTAGLAGMAKVALALERGVLPPTLNVTEPNAGAHGGPLYVNSELRPWVADGAHPRRAGVSAFGFGGTNFHAVLEEYTGDLRAARERPAARRWPAELAVVTGTSRAEVGDRLDALARVLDVTEAPLADVAAALWREADPDAACRLAVVATSTDDLAARLDGARAALAGRAGEAEAARGGVHLTDRPLAAEGEVAFLFPGQGSQYPGMLGELAWRFPEVRAAFEEADRVLGWRLSDVVFPPPAFSDEERERARHALSRTEVAQPALAAAGMGLRALLRALGVAPGLVAGHSSGQFVALGCAGALSERDLYRVAEARGRCIVDHLDGEAGTMAAVAAPVADVEAALKAVDGVWIANVNGPHQTVISGGRAEVEAAVAALAERKLAALALPVACGFHSPLVAAARDPFAAVLAATPLVAPTVPTFANETAARYPADPAAIAASLADHLVSPVLFADELEAMHAEGARVFVEVGPRQVLTNLAGRILGERPHLAVGTDAERGGALAHLLTTLARLVAHGVPVDLDRLWAGRTDPDADLAALARRTRTPLPATTWMVDGGRARPASTAPVLHRPVALTPAVAEPALVPAATGLPRGPEVDSSLGRFQDLMGKFLDTQRQVMLAYLGQAPAAAAPPVPAAIPVALAEEPAPPPAPVPEGEPDEPVADRSRDRLTDALLAIVADRTGYPVEMLDLDVDVEAELQIDSVKRVEIVGAFQEAFLHDDEDRMRQAMEELPGIKTLRGVVEVFERILGAGDGGAHAPEAAPEPEPLARYVVETIDLAAAGTEPALTGTWLVVDDGGDVAEAVAARLAECGATPVVVAPVTDPDAAARLRDGHGAVSGLVHLPGLRAPGEPGDEIRRQVVSLFLLAQAFGPDLRQLVAATGLGGTFSAAGRPLPAIAAGGVAGLVKTLAWEWPEAACRVVDVDGTLDPTALAALVVAELGAPDREVEVGHRDGRRLGLRLRPAPLAPAETEDPGLGPESVVLVLGGARGITARVALALAAESRPTLVLAGRTPRPEGNEDPATAGLTAERDIKAALARRPGATPADVHAGYLATVAEREVRATLAAGAAAGARVEYHQVDGRDAEAVRRLVEAVYRDHGRLDGVVHGAGIIDDALVESKRLDGFERVIDTKVAPALALAEAVRPDSLTFFVLFGSVCGRLGNAGQCDYAAANDILARLGEHLDARWPGRVTTLAWGPWHGAGMVTDAVARQFEARGVELVDPDAGARACRDEIAGGRRGDTEVVLGSGPWAGARPLLEQARVRAHDDGLALARALDPARDRYLADHVLDGKPVFPAAMALELMAETAALVRPDLGLAEVRGLRVLGGIVLDGVPVDVEVTTGPARAAGSNGAERVEVPVEIRRADAAPRPSYTATVVLGPAAPAGPAPEDPLPAFAHDLDECYRRWLFHGPTMRGIVEVLGLGDGGVEAVLAPSDPGALVGAGPGARWLVDPVLLDAGFQLAILWARDRLGMTPLPSSLDVCAVLAPPPPGPVRCRLAARPEADGHRLVTDLWFRDAGGTTVARLEGMTFACSPALNRLGDEDIPR